MKEIFIVAEKELRDFLTGKRFLILMGIMLLLVIIGIFAGLQQYNSQLDQYKAQQDQHAKDPNWQQMIQSQQQQIEDMKSRGESQEMIDSMQASLDSMLNPPMPPFLQFFYQFYLAFNFVGVILAIVMGFDLISGERESGSLRLLLTRPTYRDSVINGKALAGVAVIVIVLGAAFLICMALLLMSQIVPAGDDLYRIITFFIVTLLFIISVFAISLLVSTFSHSSKTAVLLMLGVFVFMYVIGGFVNTVASAAMGPAPQYPQSQIMSAPISMPLPIGLNSTEPMPVPTMSPEMQAYQEAQWKYQNDSIRYYTTQQQISDVATFLSPMDTYSRLTSVILSKQKQMNMADMYSGNYRPNNKDATLFESMADRWVNVIALLVIISAAFGLAYLAFMRSDVT